MEENKTLTRLKIKGRRRFLEESKKEIIFELSITGRWCELWCCEVSSRLPNARDVGSANFRKVIRIRLANIDTQIKRQLSTSVIKS